VSLPPRSTFSILFLLAFLAGVVVGNFCDADWFFPAIFAGVVFGTGFLLRKFPKVLLVCVALSGLLTGLARFEFGEQNQPNHPLADFNDIDRRVTLTGQIVAEPDRRMDHTKYTLEIWSWNDEIVEKQVEGRLLVKLARQPEYAYGDELKISGKLKTPFETEEFNYRDYLKRYGIESVMYYPRVKKISGGNGNLLFATIFDFKKSFEDKINQIFHEPQASFMAGLLTGSRRGIPAKVLDDFNTTGLTHIIAISGYNISLVIALVTALFGRLVSRRWQFPLAAVFVVIFTLLVGAGPAVVRAAIMGLLAFFALTSGRQYHVGLAICLTAAAMVAINPLILLDDVSFQLSFAAVLGLLFVSPEIEKYFPKVPETLAMRESLLLTISAQITAVPLIVFYFDRLSIVSPLANLLAAPLIPLAMLVGFIAVAAGAVFLPAGIVIGGLAHLLLLAILKIAEYLAVLPGASVEVTWFSEIVAACYYLLLIAWLIWRKRKQKATSPAVTS